MSVKWRILEFAILPKPVVVAKGLNQIYGNSSPCKAMFYDWRIKRFKDGREQLEDDRTGGDPPLQKTKNHQAFQNLIEEDLRITIEEVVNQIGISNGSAFAILTEDLGLSKFTAL